MPNLFDPLQVGALTLRNRIIMAPLTRQRAGSCRVPNALMAKYYADRAAAGLILSEATSVTPQGVGYADTPGIWSDEQVEGWKLVTKAVHDAGGKIFLQLWHVGRVSDPVFLNGELPVAPSAIAASGHVSLVRPKREYVTPRALELDEIAGHRGRISQGRGKREARGLRRRRSAWRERLSARPVPAGQHQQAHRHLRRLDREPCASAARSDGRMYRRVGRGSRRRAPRAARRRSLDGRQRPRRNLRLRGARTRQAQDRVYRRARIRWRGQPRTAVEEGVRRRVYRERKVHEGKRAGRRSSAATPTRWPGVSRSSPMRISCAASKSMPR